MKMSYTKQRGSALIFSLLLSSLLFSLSIPYVASLISERHMSTHSYESTAAIHLAEAGAELAIWEFLYGGADFLSSEGWTGSPDKTASGSLQTAAGVPIGDYIVTVINPTSPTPVVEATGFVPDQSAVEAMRQVRVILEGGSLLNWGVFGLEGVELDSNARTDSFDSRLGPYGGANLGSNGDVGTNATGPDSIHLDSNARVNGDAFAGPGADPDEAITTDSNADITGQETALSSPVVPISMVPPVLPLYSAINLNGNNTLTISTSGKYPSITLNSNSELIINSSVTLHVTGGVELNSNSEFTITNGAKVEIYIDGWLVLNSNTQVNNLSQDPTKLLIYGTDNMTTQPNGDPGVEYNSNSDFFGLIYAPTADIDIDSNAGVFGAVFGKTVNLDSNARVHYDEALADLDDFETDLQVIAWQEK